MACVCGLAPRSGLGDSKSQVEESHRGWGRDDADEERLRSMHRAETPSTRLATLKNGLPIRGPTECVSTPAELDCGRTEHVCLAVRWDEDLGF